MTSDLLQRDRLEKTISRWVPANSGDLTLVERMVA